MDKDTNTNIEGLEYIHEYTDLNEQIEKNKKKVQKKEPQILNESHNGE